MASEVLNINDINIPSNTGLFKVMRQIEVLKNTEKHTIKLELVEDRETDR